MKAFIETPWITIETDLQYLPRVGSKIAVRKHGVDTEVRVTDAYYFFEFKQAQDTVMKVKTEKVEEEGRYRTN